MGVLEGVPTHEIVLPRLKAQRFQQLQTCAVQLLGGESSDRCSRCSFAKESVDLPCRNHERVRIGVGKIASWEIRS